MPSATSTPRGTARADHQRLKPSDVSRSKLEPIPQTRGERADSRITDLSVLWGWVRRIMSFYVTYAPYYMRIHITSVFFCESS